MLTVSNSLFVNRPINREPFTWLYPALSFWIKNALSNHTSTLSNTLSNHTNEINNLSTGLSNVNLTINNKLDNIKDITNNELKSTFYDFQTQLLKENNNSNELKGIFDNFKDRSFNRRLFI